MIRKIKKFKFFLILLILGLILQTSCMPFGGITETGNPSIPTNPAEALKSALCDKLVGDVGLGPVPSPFDFGDEPTEQCVSNLNDAQCNQLVDSDQTMGEFTGFPEGYVGPEGDLFNWGEVILEVDNGGLDFDLIATQNCILDMQDIPCSAFEPQLQHQNNAIILVAGLSSSCAGIFSVNF